MRWVATRVFRSACASACPAFDRPERHGRRAPAAGEHPQQPHDDHPPHVHDRSKPCAQPVAVETARFCGPRPLGRTLAQLGAIEPSRFSTTRRSRSAASPGSFTKLRSAAHGRRQLIFDCLRDTSPVERRAAPPKAVMAGADARDHQAMTPARVRTNAADRPCRWDGESWFVAERGVRR